MPAQFALPRTALRALRSADPALARLIEQVGPCRLEIRQADGHLAALTQSIVYQQLSGKAAATIHGRFRALFREDRPPHADEVLAVEEERLRACGLSRQKVAAVRDLCAHVSSGRLKLDKVELLEDAEILAQLTQVRGIGRWSAEMFLMFYLGRLDVWPVDDLGVRKGVKLLYRHRELPDRKKMEKIGERFRPYRTVASWYLWRLVDGTAGEW